MSDSSGIRRIPRIPPFIRLLLRLIVPVTEREYLLGDLEEAPVRNGSANGGSSRYSSWWREIGGALSLRFGSRPRRTHRLVETGREAETDRKGDGMFREFLYDLRYGLRAMRRSPGFTIVAILTLALGIGATSAIFSVVNGVLLTPAPYPEPDRIIRIQERNPTLGFSSFTVSPLNFLDWKARSESFEFMTSYTTRRPAWTGGEYPENLLVYTVMEDYLEIFGAGLALGRGFTSEEFEPEAQPVAILRHDFWQRAFGGDEDIVGESIVLNGEVHTVIGVTEPEWTPVSDVAMLLPLKPQPWWSGARGSHWLSTYGRLKPGVTLEQARAELSGIAAALEEEYPGPNEGWGVLLSPLADTLTGGLRPQLLVLLAAVALLLLIACVNVANMMLARALVRQNEVAIRMAVGAGRGRMVRQLLAESLLLASFGAVLGICLAWLGIAAFRNWPGLLLPMQDVGLDPTVLFFTAGIAVFTGVLFGLFPALGVIRSDLHPTLRQSAVGGSGARARRWRHGLVIVEVALAVVLLVGSGLLLRSLWLLQSEHPGFERSNRLMLTTFLTDARYEPVEQKRRFSEDVLTRLRALPGVTACSFATMIPLSGDDNLSGVFFEGRPDPAPGEEVIALYYRVSEDYFRSMGIPLKSGRSFSATDDPQTTRVVVISESLARDHYPDEDPIGRRIRLNGEWHEIIGVTGEVQHYTLGGRNDPPQVYLLYRQDPRVSLTYVMHTAVSPLSLAQSARREVMEVDPEQPVQSIQTVERMVGESISRPRFRTLLLACFASAALLLAAIGLYGIMSFAVSQRTHEIGVRMALGADPGAVLGLMLRNGLRLVIIGVATGLIGAFALTGLLESLLFGIGVRDAAVFILAPLLLAAIALLASLLPARRATRIDPVRALVQE